MTPVIENLVGQLAVADEFTRVEVFLGIQRSQ